jgi:hypothetical protein
MMRLRLFVIGLLCGVATGAFMLTAQDSGPLDCDIDLSLTAAMLFQAQGEAARGDAEDAIRTINIIQTTLTDIVERCEGVEADANLPEPAVALPLTQSYVSADSGFSVRFPEGWNIDESDILGINIQMVTGTTPGQDVNQIFSVNPQLESGDQALSAFIADAEQMAFIGVQPDDTLEELISTLKDFFSFMLQPEHEEFREITINDKPAVLLILQTATVDVAILGFQLDDNRFASFEAATGPGEMDAFLPTFLAFAESFQSEDSGVELSQTYTSEDATLSFDYPEDWLIDEIDVYGYRTHAVGTSTEAIHQISETLPVISPGEFAVVATIVPLEEFAFLEFNADASPSEFVDEFAAFLRFAGGQFNLEGPFELEVNGNQAFRVEFHQPTFEATLIIVAQADSGELYGVAGFSAPGELELLQPTVMAMAQSFRVSP